MNMNHDRLLKVLITPILAALLFAGPAVAYADEMGYEDPKASHEGLFVPISSQGKHKDDVVQKTEEANKNMLPSSAAPVKETSEREALEKTRVTLQVLIDEMVRNGLLTREKADAMIRKAEFEAASNLSQMPPPETGPDGKKIVRVPYIPDTVKIQMRNQIKQEVLDETQRGGMDGSAVWVNKIKIGGDLRLREESTRLDKGNTPASDYFNANSYLTRAADIWGNTSNGVHNFDTQASSDRTRLRARLAIDAMVSIRTKVGLGFSTGSSTGSPTSTNQTMGQGNTQNPGFFNKDSAVLDLAYLKYDVNLWTTFSGGRMPNPFFGTDLVWADDLNFDGFALGFKPVNIDSPTTLFMTAGWFPLTTGVSKQSSSRSLSAAQAGFEWQIGYLENRIKLAAAVYDYHGIEGVKETQDYNLLNGMGPTDYGVRSEYGARQRGNTLFRLNSFNDPNYPGYLGLASSFREFDLTGKVDIAQFDPVHVVLTGDLVKNLGFKRDEIMRRTGYDIVDGHATGYLARIEVGAPKMRRKGDWNVSLAYRYLGSDAVLDAFTNSDFGLGGTNSKGTILGFNYGVDDNTWVTVRTMSSNLIDSMVPSTSASSLNTKFAVDLIQFDLNTRF